MAAEQCPWNRCRLVADGSNDALLQALRGLSPADIRDSANQDASGSSLIREARRAVEVENRLLWIEGRAKPVTLKKNELPNTSPPRIREKANNCLSIFTPQAVICTVLDDNFHFATIA